jgi:ribonuclease VapC
MKSSSILAVVDASVIYAIINAEPLQLKSDILEHSIVTTYNLAEVANKMVLKKQIKHTEIWPVLETLVAHHYSIDMELSSLATQLSEVIDASYGISLGDKYCLALGILLKKPIYTADRIWKKLEEPLGLEIKLVR